MILKFVYFGFVACTLVVLLPGVWCDVGGSCIEDDVTNCTTSLTNQTEYACINNTCTLRSGYNQTCNATTHCLATLVCLGELCGCNTTQYYNSSSEECIERSGYNQTCNVTTHCLATLVCLGELCGCNTTEYYNSSSEECVERSGYNQTCNVTMHCLASMVCLEGLCGCNTTQYYNSSSEECVERSGYNQTCNATTHCLASMICLGDLCGCNTTQYYNSSSEECVEKLEPGYGEDCTVTTDNCNVGNGSCFNISSTCRCNENFYTHNNQCEPVSALQPRDFVVTDTTAESITLSWNVSSNDAIQEFIIMGYGSNFQNTTINGTTMTITIPGLIPGTRYDNVTVISIVDTDRGEVSVMSEYISDTTNPGQAGDIISNKKTETAIEISFMPPSEGEVDYYLVYVSSYSVVINVSTPNVTLNASTLEPGQIYDINITTYYNKKSGEVSMQYFTIPSGYGEICILSPDSCTGNNSSCYNDSTSNSTNCRCNAMFYTDTNQCKSVVSLQPNQLTIIATTAESITLSWYVSSNNVIKEFIISAIGINFKTTTVDETTLQTQIPGLQQGTIYENLTVTAIVNTDRGNVSVMSANINNVTTDPGKAGDLSVYNIYDTTKIMNISFERPQYGVDEYWVEISGGQLNNDINQTVYIASILVPPSTLSPETHYTITIISYYNNKAGEVSRQTFKTMAVPAETPVVAIVVSILVILVIIVIIIGAIIWYRRRRTPLKRENSIRMSEVVSATNPIKLKDFSFQLENMLKDEGRLFMGEFGDVADCSPNYPKEAAKLQINGPKNRYMDILPFDKTRVKLTPLDDEDKTTDYINASFIRGYKSDTEYIAAQGPLAETVDTFWRMIWEHNVCIIVMLSNFEEDGKPKVYRYYNDGDDPMQYGTISVKLQQKSNICVTGNPENAFQIQTFAIRKDNEERTVRHFFLPGWVDFGANLEPADVLEFIQRVRQEINSLPKRPLLVHCSAGVGRTGTFIALDILQQHINRLKMTQKIDIPDLVVRLRCCRCRMVQSLKQYMFIHRAVNEIIENKLGNRTKYAAGSPSLNGQTTQHYRIDNEIPNQRDNVKTEDGKTDKSNEKEKPSDEWVTAETPSEPEVTTAEKADQPKVTYINIGDRVSLITKSTENARNNDRSVADNRFHDNPTFVAEDDIKLNMETETSEPGV